MRTPIYVDENGDITSFDSIEEAQTYMEPIDVKNGQYVVRDADGKTLKVDVVVERRLRLWGLWSSRVDQVRICE
jgi:hypothetical protein